MYINKRPLFKSLYYMLIISTIENALDHGFEFARNGWMGGRVGWVDGRASGEARGSLLPPSRYIYPE